MHMFTPSDYGINERMHSSHSTCSVGERGTELSALTVRKQTPTDGSCLCSDQRFESCSHLWLWSNNGHAGETFSSKQERLHLYVPHEMTVHQILARCGKLTDIHLTLQVEPMHNKCLPSSEEEYQWITLTRCHVFIVFKLTVTFERSSQSALSSHDN